jgi:hypothetical protein
VRLHWILGPFYCGPALQQVVLLATFAWLPVTDSKVPVLSLSMQAWETKQVVP